MKRLFIYFGLAFSFLLIFVLVTNVVFYITTKQYIYSSARNTPSTEVALIPGAAILASGAPSPIFLSRVDEAIDLYKAGKVSKILVSGDNSTISHNEVNPVRVYLLGKGIPSENIFLDHAGFDTYSSMYRARVIFGVSSMLIASQSFHLPRAVFIARQMGIRAYGVRSDVGSVSKWNYVREIFADEKAVYDLVVHTKPKYLGDTIPISGDGSNYP